MPARFGTSLSNQQSRAARRNDRADAELVRDVAVALNRWRSANGREPSLKLLREAVWFFWQEPRLERPLVPRKYPRAAKWSEEAALIILRGQPRSGRLVIEHVEPMKRALRWLLDELPEIEVIVKELGRRLDCVVVTTEQAKRLPDVGSPQERYARAGMDLSAFRPLDDWGEAVSADE